MYYIAWLIRFILAFFGLYLIIDTFYQYNKLPKLKIKKTSFKYYNGIMYYLFDLIPKRLAEFIQYKQSKEFSESGLILYCGAQGEGKSYAMCHEVTKLYCEYPDVKILSNIWFEIADKKLYDYKPLLEEKNGENGIIFMLDEISMWWNSRFRSLDPTVLSELVTNRKNHRVLFGTCQNISMCDKQVRIQASEFRNVHCFFGAFILCTCWRPEFDMSTGDLKDKHFLGFKIYMQDDVIRASYDTFEMINLLNQYGSQYEKPVDVVVKGGENEKKSLFKKSK